MRSLQADNVLLRIEIWISVKVCNIFYWGFLKRRSLLNRRWIDDRWVGIACTRVTNNCTFLFIELIMNLHMTLFPYFWNPVLHLQTASRSGNVPPSKNLLPVHLLKKVDRRHSEFFWFRLNHCYYILKIVSCSKSLNLKPKNNTIQKNFSENISPCLDVHVFGWDGPFAENRN